MSLAKKAVGAAKKTIKKLTNPTPAELRAIYKEAVKFDKAGDKKFKEASAAHNKLWASESGSTEAKRWNAEWKRLETEGVALKKKARALFDKFDRLKAQKNPKKRNSIVGTATRAAKGVVSAVGGALASNPRYLVTAEETIKKARELGILEDRSATAALNRAKKLYSGQGLKKFGAKKRNAGGSKKRNIEQGFYDGKGQFHPVRSSTDYNSAKAGQRGTFRGEVFARDKRTKQWHHIPLGKTSWPSKAAAIAAGNQETSRRGKRGQYAAFKAVPLGQEPNPNSAADANREKFAGSVAGHKELYFPEGTPQGLSTLGPLVLIRTEAGDVAPVSGAAYLCQDTRGHLFIGTSKPNAPLYNGPAGSFGKITRVEYRCRKPHLGYPDTVTWFHDFEDPLPTLRADGKGGLSIAGGGYKIRREGIVG